MDPLCARIRLPPAKSITRLTQRIHQSLKEEEAWTPLINWVLVDALQRIIKGKSKMIRRIGAIMNEKEHVLWTYWIRIGEVI